jgi:aromatic ring-opening dioxygenase catalytic subunit (LigB family)
MEAPKTIHDFGGFPQALYDTHYPAPGSPELAQRLVELLAPVPVTLDKEAWGFDHGSWGVLIKMYPDADIPMVQLSIDSTKPAHGISKWGVSWLSCAMKALCWWPAATWCITCVPRAGTARIRPIPGRVV